MVFEAIAGGLVKVALPKVAGAIAKAVKDKLNPTELQRALEVGLKESGGFDRGQKARNPVFYRSTDKDTDTFLAALLEHPEVQRELQKPLEQEGAPDVAMLVQAAKQIAIDLTLSVQDETLEPWLKAFANAYFDAITAIRFQVAQADYLEQLANWFDDVKFAGVAVPGQDVERAERLAQIFVMPDVEEEARRGWGGEGLRGWGDEGLTDDRQSQLLQEQRMRAQLERSGRKFSARQLLNQHQKKVVLLGAPGSGKTTLMSFFAVTLAEQQGAIATASDVSTEGLDRNTEGTDRDRSQIDRHTEGTDRDPTQTDRLTQGIDRDRSSMQPDTTRMHPDAEGLRLDATGLQTHTDVLPLPILVRIRDWARTPDVTLPEYARQFAETTMSCKLLPKGFFEHWLNNGRALILLDGLDEVAEEAKRYHLVQCIENFLGQYPQNRAIITSRPAGYKRDFFRTEEFPHYELQPFDDKKIEEFCDRWYRSRIQDTAEALRRKESLQKALNQQDRIKLLARNPLLLTIIALIHRYQARLPRERYKLYDKAVETLLTAWDDNKELSNQTVLQYLQLDDLRRLMESLAYWIHTQGNTGDTEGGTLIDKDELIQKLCQEIKTLKQLQHYEAKAEAERFVKFIRDRTGLLNEQGQDCYAFVHKTFQEYLAAQDINYQADNEDDFEIVLTHIEQHLHDPHWREVLLLLIAQQSPKKAARAIRKVLTANSPYEQWLHRDLLFAGRCLTEDPKGLKGADPSLSLEILEELIELGVSETPELTGKIRSQINYIPRHLEETEFEAEALRLLKNRKERISRWLFLEYQADLGEREATISALLLHLQNPEALDRAKAALTLSSLGNASEEILNALLTRLRQDQVSHVRASTAEALGKLGYASEPVITELLSRLQDPYSDVRSRAAEALGKLGKSSESTVVGLCSLLQDRVMVVRSRAAEALGKLGNSCEEVVMALLAQIQISDSSVRSSAASALASLGDSTGVITRELLTKLQSPDSYIRCLHADALGALGNASEEVIDSLLALLNDQEGIVRSMAAGALGKLNTQLNILSDKSKFTQKLEVLLEDPVSVVRSTTLRTLGKLEVKSESVMSKAVALIQDADVMARLNVAYALGSFGETTEEVISGLLVLLQDSDSRVCYGAIDSLGKLEHISELVVNNLLCLLQAPDSSIRSRTQSVLVKLSKKTDWVETALVQWIEQHQDEDCVGAGIDALWEIVEGV
ncbi:HEAT repeat domain-containing protein [Stenomitos frigidus]|uniref:HEAT repeat domain-containing protein n=1 Tax=Stenomitos frigidus TaxID=1886765 RepID=UPI0015E66A31|nr:HEAT repeat domain-containing protein [Stenomitos frigidus]